MNRMVEEIKKMGLQKQGLIIEMKVSLGLIYISARSLYWFISKFPSDVKRQFEKSLIVRRFSLWGEKRIKF